MTVQNSKGCKEGRTSSDTYLTETIIVLDFWGIPVFKPSFSCQSEILVCTISSEGKPVLTKE